MNGSGAAAAAAATATATAAYETGASSCVDAASKTMAAVARAGKVKVLTLFTIFFFFLTSIPKFICSTCTHP